MTAANDPAEQVRATLVSAAGGFLRNTLRIPGVTCSVCSTPISPGYEKCWPCHSHASKAPAMPTADHVGILTYAIHGRQSAYFVYGYKAPQPVQEHRNIMGSLVILGIYYHIQCIGKIAGRPVTHWTTVPSLPPKPGEHPLHSIVSPTMSAIPEVTLTASAQVADPRAFQNGHFTAAPVLPPGSHVLLIDDTWTSGGHVQSANLALRRSGASVVSILTGARYLRENYGENANFVKTRLNQDYNPLLCPWTGGQCP